MQLLYAVRFSATSDLATQPAFELIRQHVQAWCQARFCAALDESALSTAGSTRGAARTDDGRTVQVDISWTGIQAAGLRSLRLSTRQPIEGISAHLEVAVTILERGDETTCRIVVGRSTDSDVLAPSAFSSLKPPTLVRSILIDEKLTCSVHGVQIEPRYLKVNSIDELKFLTFHLDHEQRLPLLIVDTVRADRLQFAKDASTRLAGLAQVVCIGFAHVLRNFNESYPEASVPFAGARLVWPSAPRHPLFYEDEIGDKALSQAFRMLVGTAVVTYSLDRDWALALQADRNEQAKKASEEMRIALAQAAEKGDQAAQVRVLESAVEAERERANKAEAELADYIQEFDTAEGVRSENYMLRQRLAAYEHGLPRNTGVVVDPFDDTEVPGLDESFQSIVDYLELASDGACVFTANAVRQWQQCDHPRPDQLRQAVIQLAKASCAWRDTGGSVGVALPDWFKTEFELNYAPKDEPLRRQKLHLFDFDGETLERVSHLKLDDHVPPNQVGRIYFAMDRDRMRFVVDHIGLKLYGI